MTRLKGFFRTVSIRFSHNLYMQYFKMWFSSNMYSVYMYTPALFVCGMWDSVWDTGRETPSKIILEREFWVGGIWAVRRKEKIVNSTNVKGITSIKLLKLFKKKWKPL
jgi:hypothetical protein